MTERYESLSALMDNAADTDAEALEQLLSSTEDQQQWSRYHLIGQAMRDELPSHMDLNLSARIADAIADEPTVLSPTATPSATPESNEPAELINMSKRRAKRASVVKFVRHAGQYAIAATVAAVAVIGVQQYSAQGDGDAVDNNGPVLETRPLIGGAAPVSLDSSAPVRRSRPDISSREASQQRLIEQRMRINAYLQDHELQMRMQQRNAQANERQAQSARPERVPQGD